MNKNNFQHYGNNKFIFLTAVSIFLAVCAVWVAFGVIGESNDIGLGLKDASFQGEIDYNKIKNKSSENTGAINNSVRSGQLSEKADDSKNVTGSQGKIILKGKQDPKGINLFWETEKIDLSLGFKILKSEEINPFYPGSENKNASGREARSYLWEINDGKDYHFRVCQYDGKECLIYSNDIIIEAPKKEEDIEISEDDEGENEKYAEEVTLYAEKKSDEINFIWAISGGDAPKGFKILMSREKNPSYPEDKSKNISDPEVRNAVWKEGLEENETYHFRVCIWEGEKCGVYSGDEKVEF